MDESPFRREKRYSLAADIRVITEEGEAVALSTLDISCGGLGTDGLTPFESDKAVRVEFTDGTIRTGRTRWCEEFSSGILFDLPFSPSELEVLRTALTSKPFFDQQRG